MSYSIDQFSKITSINKLVLRTWENRYNFLKADRTKTNIRTYSDKLLIQGLNASLLLKNGYKISFISKKSEEELTQIVDSIKKNSNPNLIEEYYINKLIQSSLSYNTKLFNHIYKEGTDKIGLIDFYKNVILKTFSKIGLFWLTNRINPGQEHFLSELIKQKIFSEIEKISHPTSKQKNWLLFLPPNEHHEIGLIFSKFLLLQNGYEVIYLGANVPLTSLDYISKKKKIDNILFFSISNLSQIKLSETLDTISQTFKKSKRFLVSRSMIDSSKKSKYKLNIIPNIDYFVNLIDI